MHGYAAVTRSKTIQYRTTASTHIFRNTNPSIYVLSSRNKDSWSASRQLMEAVDMPPSEDRWACSVILLVPLSSNAIYGTDCKLEMRASHDAICMFSTARIASMTSAGMQHGTFHAMADITMVWVVVAGYVSLKEA